MTGPCADQARAHSQAEIGRIGRAVEALPPADRRVLDCLVVAGSLGRLEAGPLADCDAIVVVRPGTDPAEAAALHALLWETLEGLGLHLPKQWGIFTTPTSRAELCDPARLGRLDESPAVFGKRMQLLMDCRAAWGAAAFAELRGAILDWYGTGFVGVDPAREWTLLLNDAQRYFRSYCAWQQYRLEVEPDEAWYVRNAKLRFSRLMNYAGLVLLLGEGSRHGVAKRAWFEPRLELPPLDRVAEVYTVWADPGIDLIHEAYEVFLQAMADPGLREELVRSSPRTLADLPPALTPAYAPLQAASARIIGELTRFLRARMADWSPRFVEYLLF